MTSLKFFQVSEVTLRSKMFGLREFQFRPTTAVVCHLLSVIARTELVQLPLTVLVTQCLRIAQTFNRLDVQFHRHLRLKPFIQVLVVGKHTIRYDIVVQSFSGPYVISARAFRVKWGTSRVIIQRLLEVCLLILIRSIGSTSSLTIIHDRTDL